MATYVKGNPVENATSYELLEKVGSAYNSLKTGSEINFDVSALGLSAGDHTLVVKAKADGYEDSDYSNEVTYTVEGGTVWYYTPSVRDGASVGSVTYDCPNASNTTFGYAMANENALSKIRNKPINLIKFRLSPDETKTSGTMKFAVMPINGTSYTRYIEAAFTAADIQNSWVTVKLDEAFTIGDGETFVIQPVDSSHTASSVAIAILRASVATTTDEYIAIYHTVPKTWGSGGNYETRLGLCVDLGYTN